MTDALEERDQHAMSSAPSVRPAEPSKDEYWLRTGDYTAIITKNGAALRQLRHRGRDLVVPFDDGASNLDFRGVIAAPWPNRVRDGRYVFDGTPHQLPLNEPCRRCALHGLVYQYDWTLESRTHSAIVLSLDLNPTPGYPFSLHLTADYRLSESGLHTRVRARNTGRRTAPYGICPHPYLIAGPGKLDDWTLESSAETFLEVTSDRLLPTGSRSVAGHEFDFRTPRPIGATQIDHAFTDVEFDGDGYARLTVRDPGGTGTGMAWSTALPWVQVHTADKRPPRIGRRGLAVEPMTCPPDAFNSGTDLVGLTPGAEHGSEWLIYGIAAPS